MGELIGGLATSESRVDLFFRHQELRREAIAEHFNAPAVVREARHEGVAEGVDTTGMEEQMCEFVEEGENLARLGRAVVDVDNREDLVVKGEARVLVDPECVLEYEDARLEQSAAPFL